MTLSAYLITYLVHDIVSPLTALTSTLDLAQMEDDFWETGGEEMIQKSAQSLKDRIRFFRALWGLEGPFEDTVAPKYLKTLSIPITLVGTAKTQMQLGAVLLGIHLLPSGGTLTLSPTNLKIQGQHFKNVSEIQKLLTTGGELTLQTAPILAFKEKAPKATLTQDKDTLILSF